MVYYESSGVNNTENTISKKNHNCDNSRKRGNMLRDSLQKLIDSPGRERDCKLGNIIKSLDGETAAILVEALKSDASTMGLVRALKDEGIPVSREYLGEKRNTCFKAGGAGCCLAQNAESKEKRK
jgi:hypothetical protein